MASEIRKQRGRLGLPIRRRGPARVAAEPGVTPPGPRPARAPGGELPIARLVALLLLLIPVGAWVVVSQIAKLGPSDEAKQLASVNPRTLFGPDNTVHFLPTPVPAIPPETGAGPPARAAGEAGGPAGAPERVKVANTGGIGAILRAEPPQGRPVTGLRDGQVLRVLERREVDNAEWLRVSTQDGAEGWIFGRLVGPAQ